MVVNNSKPLPPNSIDLHGLYVHEATERTEKAILKAQLRGDTHIRIIVGKVSLVHLRHL